MVLLGFVAYGFAWYQGAIDGNFTVLLFAAVVVSGVYWLAEIGISSHVYRMLPYLITLVVLAFTSKKSRAPKAEGIPYDKGQR